MPSGAVELEDDPLVCASADRLGEVQKDTLEQLLANRIRDVPYRGAGRWLNEAPDIEPFVAVMAKRSWPLPLGSPDASQMGFKPILCSSIAQISMAASGCCCFSSAAASCSFF